MRTHFVHIHTFNTRNKVDEPYDFDNDEDFIFETPMEMEDHLTHYDGTLEDIIRTSYTRREFL